jgi:hypothetical protein
MNAPVSMSIEITSELDMDMCKLAIAIDATTFGRRFAAEVRPLIADAGFEGASRDLKMVEGIGRALAERISRSIVTGDNPAAAQIAALGVVRTTMQDAGYMILPSAKQLVAQLADVGFKIAAQAVQAGEARL